MMDNKVENRTAFFSCTRWAVSTLFALLIVILVNINGSARADFNPSYIISDPAFTNTATMTEADVQAFLESKGSYLADYYETRDSYIGPNNDIAARGWRASKIIWNVANWYGINPQVILATLQKEQSLITNPAPPAWAIDWAMGYGCPDSSPCSSYPGLAMQVDWGTWQLRWNMDLANSRDSRVAPYLTGDTITIDDTPVYLQNGATASLYRYTPHFHGNQNFVIISERWFSVPLFYPLGNIDSLQGTPLGFQVNGWAIDPDTTDPIDVHLYVDDQYVTAFTADGARPDVGAAYPGYGDSHGFSAQINNISPGPHTVCAYGINTGAGGNNLLGCSTVDVSGNSLGNDPLGNVDSLQAAPLGFQVNGWVIDPDTTDPIDVHLYVDDQYVTAFTADGARPDVGAAYPGFGDNHGYSAQIDNVSPGQHMVCTYGINVGAGDTNPLLGCEVVTISSDPFGNIDSLQGITLGFQVNGWAIDPDTTDPIDVHLYVDDQYVTAFTADGARTDVGAAFPGHGDNHGYSAQINNISPGPHTVCTYGINVGAGDTNPLLGCEVVTIPSDPFGNLDSWQGLPFGFQVNGWAIDPDVTDPIDVHIYVDDRFAAAFTADGARTDVGGAYPGYGDNHGYSAQLDNVSPGQHTVCAYSINVGAGDTNTLLGCTVVDVLSGDPFGNLDSASVANPGQVDVSGWAIDPDTTDPIDVHLYVDDQYVTAFTADGARTDVGGAYPGYGDNHGYSAQLDNVSSGPHTVCTYGINTGPGGNNLLGCTVVDVLSGDPFGNLDSASVANPGQVDVNGWGIDPDTTDPIDVHLYVDDQYVTAFTADSARTDVGSAYPGYGDNHGYSAQLDNVSPGQHTVCAYGINVGAGDTNPLLGCKVVDVLSGDPFGNLDGVSMAAPGEVDVSGWAIDPDTTDPIQIHIYVNGQWGGAFTADTTRTDVGAAYPGYGAAHGFSGTVPVSAASNDICAYSINTGLGNNAFLGCTTVPAPGVPITLTSDTAFNAVDGDGTLLATFNAGETVTVSYSSDEYFIQAPGVSRTSQAYVRLNPVNAEGIMQVTSYHDIPSWDTSLDDNRFRGSVEIRYSPVSQKVWVINDLPLELYLRGIAESSSGAPQEFLKTMSVAARDYALYHVNRGGKYYENGQDIFHLKNSRNGNGDDQVYKGYGLEARFPDLTAAVTATNGLVVTYNGSLAITPYFSNSDGRTRSAQEAWGVTYWPWLTSVPDPDCAGMALNGHGVGMSGHGAYMRAERGDSFNDILTYYYQGTVIQPLSTDMNVRVAIYSTS